MLNKHGNEAHEYHSFGVPFRLSRIVCNKVVMQGKLIAGAYTLRTY